MAEHAADGCISSKPGNGDQGAQSGGTTGPPRGTREGKN